MAVPRLVTSAFDRPIPSDRLPRGAAARLGANQTATVGVGMAYFGREFETRAPALGAPGSGLLRACQSFAAEYEQHVELHEHSLHQLSRWRRSGDRAR